MNWLPQHPLKQFLLLFVIAYAVLMALASFTGLKNVYELGYRNLGNKFFMDYKGKGIVIFDKGTDDKPLKKGLTTQIILVSKAQNQQAIANSTNVRRARVYVSPFRTGLFPTIILFALILASPIVWKRKAWVMLIGFILISLFVYYRAWLTILINLQMSDWLEVVSLSPKMFSFVKWLEAVTVGNIVFSVVVPTFIWFLVTFRKEDRKVLFSF